MSTTLLGEGPVAVNADEGGTLADGGRVLHLMALPIAATIKTQENANAQGVPHRLVSGCGVTAHTSRAVDISGLRGSFLERPSRIRAMRDYEPGLALEEGHLPTQGLPQDLVEPSDNEAPISPSRAQYEAFDRIFEHFNQHLFAGALPPVLLTFSRRRGARGWFAPGLWSDGNSKVAEIALNPDTFPGRTADEVASTICHEMCHLWQAEFGRPSRRGYHNCEWGDRMEKIGLIPTDTGLPGGRRTGQRVTHFIQEGGSFARVFAELGPDAFFPFGIAAVIDPGRTTSQNRRNKTRHTCLSCGMNAWGKPQVHLICGDCDIALVPTT